MASNRTLEELKLDGGVLNTKRDCFFQSHLRGIETNQALYNSKFFRHFQSHLRGIETISLIFSAKIA